jgi:hypothetical protein
VKGRSFLAAALASSALLVAPASSPAAFDFGSNLTPTPAAQSCELVTPSCTFWQTAIHPLNAAGTLASPIDGIVVSYTLKTSAGSWSPIHLRVIQPLGSGSYRGSTITSADVTPTTAADTETFPVRLYIEEGWLVGFESDTPGAVHRASAPNIFGGNELIAAPKLPANGNAASGFVSEIAEVLLRARVEPDKDGDGFGDETQDKCPSNPTKQGVCGAKKKCKKKKKKRKGKNGASSSKKRKCRKKRRK